MSRILIGTSGFSYDDWRGRKMPRSSNIVAQDATTGNFRVGVATEQAPETFTVNWRSYPCKGMVAVTGADIANKTSTGKWCLCAA